MITWLNNNPFTESFTLWSLHPMILSRNDPSLHDDSTSWWLHLRTPSPNDPLTWWSIQLLIFHNQCTLLQCSSSPLSLGRKSSSRPPSCPSCSARPAFPPAVSLLMNPYIQDLFFSEMWLPRLLDNTQRLKNPPTCCQCSACLTFPLDVDDSPLIQTNRIW